MEDRTMTISKHEVVLNRMFVEDIWELAFGADAWEDGHYDVAVYQKLMEYSKKALAWDKFYESIAEPEVIEDDTEENYFLREKMIRILKEVEDE